MTTVSESGAETPDYKSTLFLPKTDFPMRAGLPRREPEWLERWARMGLYDRLRRESAGRAVYTLHDGPPYANGHLHIGHALNKILKDMVVRARQMAGYDSRYVPGWDCHGLPIEWKIEEQYRARGKSKDDVAINELRRECRAFAESWVDIQREEFKRLGVTGDWDRPYKTMDFSAESTIAREFLKFVMNGTLYRGSKPVMWSPVEKTALAEAEVEYKDHESPTIWVKFRVTSAPTGALSGASVIIWTTTPWTIPSNKGVVYSPEISYGLYEVTVAPEDNWVRPGERIALADNLAEDAMGRARVEDYVRLHDLTAQDFEGAVLAHPWRGADWAEKYWDYDVDFRAAGFVTDDQGTGFVHCAPSHGQEEYDMYRDLGMLDRVITYNVEEDGSFAAYMPELGGKRILKPNGKEGNANKAVIEKLAESGQLFARGKIRHSYPHSWRSKAPVIYRNTPQWFVAIDKPLEDGTSIRQRALRTIDADVAWTPQSGRNRLYSMVENRPDWVLSRQRAWGVPLCCFMRETVEGGVKTTEILRDERVNARIVEAFAAEGADAWFEEGARERFLDGLVDPAEWTQVMDILDVWFDSGSTHAFVLEDREDSVWPASLYLEGTDQHRGWFQSSLLESCGTRGRAPYDAVLTHGFTLDEKGQKMSKSLGNIIAPQTVVDQYGADILRLWVAQADYTEDQRIGPEILKGVADSYRRLRNTLRFMIGALDGFSDDERVAPADMPELERWVLHRLAEVDAQVRRGYDRFEFSRVFSALFTFCTVDLSSVYFDIRKDALYCDAPGSLRRRACRTVLELLFERLTTWAAPILCFTMEEVWLTRHAGEDSSVHAAVWPDTPQDWRDDALAAKWARIRAVRRVVTGALEIARRDKTIGASLEAAPIVHVGDEDLRALLASVDLDDLCITSGITVTGDAAPEDAFALEDVPGVAVVFARASGAKCARCWKVLPDVGDHGHAGVCGRCDGALG